MLLFYVLPFVLTILNNRFVSALQIEIDVNNYDGVIPNSFKISCHPGVTGNCAKKILAIQVSRGGGRSLATIEGNSEISYNRLLRSNIEAEGHIDKEAEKSTLTVTFSDVVAEDSGQYSCVMIYLDEWGYLQQEVAVKNFTVESESTQDVVRYLMGKLSSMEAMLEQLQTWVTTQKDELQQISTNAATQQDELEKLQTHSATQETELQELKTYVATQNDILQMVDNKTDIYMKKDSQVSAFMVGYTGSKNVNKGQVLTFPRVLLNMGNDFHPGEGVYRAPVDGLYSFQLFGMSYRPAAEIQVHIVSDDEVAARFLVRNVRDLYDQSSVNCLLKLTSGQTVKCVVSYSQGSVRRLHPFPYTGFMGHLIKAL